MIDTRLEDSHPIYYPHAHCYVSTIRVVLIEIVAWYCTCVWPHLMLTVLKPLGRDVC
jgi:hypothetical protein